jgi:hypothetical protein
MSCCQRDKLLDSRIEERFVGEKQDANSLPDKGFEGRIEFIGGARFERCGVCAKLGTKPSSGS